MNATLVSGTLTIEVSTIEELEDINGWCKKNLHPDADFVVIGDLDEIKKL